MEILFRPGNLLPTIEDMLRRGFPNVGEKIAKVSEIFLGVPYMEKTLPDWNSHEVLVANFEGMDCMTFLEYVEALRHSSNFEEFFEWLKKVRYKEGKITFKDRKHFFTDWIYYNTGLDEVTGSLKKGGFKRIVKILNESENGSRIIPGLEREEREILYIPKEMIDKEVTEKLFLGDYVGFFTHKAGLDCSHVGIIVKKGPKTYLRHASKVKGCVLDEDFLDYVEKKEGIIVLRPR